MANNKIRALQNEVEELKKALGRKDDGSKSGKETGRKKSPLPSSSPFSSSRPPGQVLTRETRQRRGTLRELSTSSSEDEREKKRTKEDTCPSPQPEKPNIILPPEEEWPPAFRPPIKGIRKRLDTHTLDYMDGSQYEGIEARIMNKIKSLFRSWKEEQVEKERKTKKRETKLKGIKGTKERKGKIKVQKTPPPPLRCYLPNLGRSIKSPMRRHRHQPPPLPPTKESREWQLGRNQLCTLEIRD